MLLAVQVRECDLVNRACLLNRNFVHFLWRYILAKLNVDLQVRVK